MASKFNIVAELSLRGPKNLKPLVRNIQKQLQSVNIPVNVQVNANTQKALNQINSSMKGVQNSSKGMAQTATVAASNLAQVGNSGTKAAASVSKVAKQSANASKQLKQTGDAALSAANKMKLFGEQAGLAVKRFAAFSIPTGIMIGFTTAISNGFREAIEFERELVKIAQVSGRTVNSLRGLTKEITRLATTFGVSSQELLETSRILAQTGMTAKETQTALGALAKASLAPTFKDMNDTVEASIAAMRQFGIAADQLESKLGAINAVAGSFAVEASDISFAIRRTGGAFKAAGGQLEELIALFTSVRSTTRESAETIATGFRTIFTRIQRPQTIAYLRELGVELQNAAGQFVGPMEAIKRLNAALANVPTTDPRFSQIVEQIGGYRQVSKVIPLITKYNETVKAYIVAQSGATSLAEDANKAQGALAVQIQKTKEEFSAFLRNLTQDNSIQDFVKNTLQLARAFIKVADSAKSMLPMLASIAAFKGVFGGLAFARGFGQGLTNFGGQGGLGGQLGRRVGGGPAGGGGGVGIAVGGGGGGARQTQSASRNTAALTANTTAINNLNNVIRTNLVSAINNLSNRVGAISVGVGGVRGAARGARRGFATGGIVPGQGTGDSVPAMLTPGEFVIKRSSAKKIGYNRLASMNKYAGGGTVKLREQVGMLSRGKDDKTYSHTMPAGPERTKTLNSMLGHIQHAINRHVPNKAKHSAAQSFLMGPKGLQLSGTIDSDYLKASPSFTRKFENPLIKSLEKGQRKLEKSMRKAGKSGKLQNRTDKLKVVSGQVFEDYAFGLAGRQSPATRNFDIVPSEIADFQGLTHSGSLARYTDIKLNPNSAYSRDSVIGKGFREKSSMLFNKSGVTRAVGVALRQQPNLTRKARGGGISGSDTVPAMLTPGEYVINAKSARNIGYGALNAMNKSGTIKGFNKGGSVGVQKFNNGGQAGGQMGLLLAVALPTIVANFQAAGEGASDMAKGFADFTAKMTTAIMILTMMPRNFASGMGGMGGSGAAIKGFAGGLFGRRSPIMQAGVPVPREGSPLARRQAGYEKGRAARGTAAAGAALVLSGAFAATMSVVAENSRKASEATIQGARSMADAATAIKQANTAAKAQGASQGSMIGGGIGGAILMSGVIANPVIGLITALGAALVGGVIGWFASGDDAGEARKIQQEVRKKLVGDSSDAIRDAITDVESKRATFEAKALTIRKKLLENESLLLSSTGKDFSEIQRQLRSSVSGLYSIGNTLVGSSKNLKEFKQASGGLGQALIRQIALIRGIPTKEVEKQFADLIEAQQNSIQAQKNLANSTRALRNTYKSFDQLTRRLDRTSHSLNNMSESLGRLTSTMFGEFSAYESPPDYDLGLLKNVDFTDIRNVGGFNASVASLVSPFGAEGEVIKREAAEMASAMGELPSILKEAQKKYLASGKTDDFGDILTKMLGNRFGELTQFILDFVADKLSTAEGESSFLSEIDKDSTNVVEGMLSGPSKELASSISELAEVTERHAKALESINARKLAMENRMLRENMTLVRGRFAQEKEMRSLTGSMLSLQQARNKDREEENAIFRAAGINPANYAGDTAGRRAQVQGELLGIRKDIARKEAELDMMASDDPGRIKAAEELNNLKIKANGLNEVFKRLNSSSTEYINALKQKIQTERKAAQQLQSGAIQYAFGTDEQRQSMDIGAMYAMSGIPIDQVPSEYRGNVSSIYKSLSDVELAGFGGITAEEKRLFNKYNISRIGGRATGDMGVGDRRTGRAKELYDTYKFLRGRGFDEETAAKIAYAGASTKEEKLIAGLEGYLNKQQQSQQQFLNDLGTILRQGFADRKEIEDRKAEAGIEAARLAREEERKKKEIEAKRDESSADRIGVDAADAFEANIRKRSGAGNIKDDHMSAIIAGLTGDNAARVTRYNEYRALNDARTDARVRRAGHIGPAMMTRDDFDFRYADSASLSGGPDSNKMAKLARYGRVTSWDHFYRENQEGEMKEEKGVEAALVGQPEVMSDRNMRAFSEFYKDSHIAERDDLMKGLKSAGFDFNSEEGTRVTAAQEAAVNKEYKAYADKMAERIGTQYGLTGDEQGELAEQIRQNLTARTFGTTAEGERYYRGPRMTGGAGAEGPRIAGMMNMNSAYLEHLGTYLNPNLKKYEEARKAFHQERDALSTSVFGGQYDALNDEQKSIIDAAFASSRGEGLGHLNAAADVASEGIHKVKDRLDDLAESVHNLDTELQEIRRDRATQEAIRKYGHAPDGKFGYDALDKAEAKSLSDKDVKKDIEKGGIDAAKIFYDPDSGQYYQVRDKKPVFLSKGGMLGAFKSKGKDTIPAMLAKGEAVLTPEQMESLGITGKSLKAAGVPTVYASGGAVLGSAPAANGIATLDDTNRILSSILDELKKPAVSYFNEGGSIFKPKGTDTVPAMLTPGEFVIKKSSVDKYGAGMLSAINAGYYNEGGMVDRLRERKRIRKDIRGKQEAVEDRYRIDQFKQAIADGTVSNVGSRPRGYDPRFGAVQGLKRRNMPSTRFFNDGGSVKGFAGPDTRDPIAAAFEDAALQSKLKPSQWREYQALVQFGVDRSKAASIVQQESDPLKAIGEGAMIFAGGLADATGSVVEGALDTGQMIGNVGVAGFYGAKQFIPGVSAYDDAAMAKLYLQKAGSEGKAALQSGLNVVTLGGARMGDLGGIKDGQKADQQFARKHFGEDYARTEALTEFGATLVAEMASPLVASKLSKVDKLVDTTKVADDLLPILDGKNVNIPETTLYRGGTLSTGKPRPYSYDKRDILQRQMEGRFFEDEPLMSQGYSQHTSSGGIGDYYSITLPTEQARRYDTGLAAKTDAGRQAMEGVMTPEIAERFQLGSISNKQAMEEIMAGRAHHMTSGRKSRIMHAKETGQNRLNGRYYENPLQWLGDDSGTQRSVLVGGWGDDASGEKFLPPHVAAQARQLYVTDPMPNLEWRSGISGFIHPKPSMSNLVEAMGRPGAYLDPAGKLVDPAGFEKAIRSAQKPKPAAPSAGGVNLYSGLPMPSKEQLKAGYQFGKKWMLPNMPKGGSNFAKGQMTGSLKGWKKYARLTWEYGGKQSLPFAGYGAYKWATHNPYSENQEKMDVDLSSPEMIEAAKKYNVEYARGGMVGFKRERGEGLGQKKRWREEQARKAAAARAAAAKKAQQEAQKRAQQAPAYPRASTTTFNPITGQRNTFTPLPASTAPIQQDPRQQALMKRRGQLIDEHKTQMKDRKFYEYGLVNAPTSIPVDSRVHEDLFVPSEQQIDTQLFDLRQRLLRESDAQYAARMQEQFMGRFEFEQGKGKSIEDFYRWLYSTSSPKPTVETNPQQWLEQKIRKTKDNTWNQEINKDIIKDIRSGKATHDDLLPVGPDKAVPRKVVPDTDGQTTARSDNQAVMEGREHMLYDAGGLNEGRGAVSRIPLDHVPLNPEGVVSDGHIRYGVYYASAQRLLDQFGTPLENSNKTLQPAYYTAGPNKGQGIFLKAPETKSWKTGKSHNLPPGLSWGFGTPHQYYKNLQARYTWQTLKSFHETAMTSGVGGVKGPILPDPYWERDEEGNIIGKRSLHLDKYTGSLQERKPPARGTHGAFGPDPRLEELKNRLNSDSYWTTITGNRVLSRPIEYKKNQYGRGWVNFELNQGGNAAHPLDEFIDDDQYILKEYIKRNFRFASGGMVNPWATNPAMLAMIMRMYGSMPSGFKGANRGLVKSKDYYHEVDDKDAFIDSFTGHKTIHKGKIERRERFYATRNRNMYARMKGRNPMMTLPGGRTYQKWVKNPNYDPTQPKGPGNEMFLPREQKAAVNRRMPLLETLDKDVPGNATVLQQEVFKGMHVDYGKGAKFNKARRALLTRRVEAAFGRLLQTGLFTTAGSIENLNLTRDNAKWVYRLLDKAPQSNDMGEIKTAYRRIINYKGSLGGQAVKPFYDPYEGSGGKNITGNKDTGDKDTTNWSDYSRAISKDYVPEPSRYREDDVKPAGPVVRDPAWRPPPWTGPYPPGLEGITPKMWAAGKGPHGGTGDWRLDLLDYHYPAYANEIRKWLKPDTAGFGGEYNQYWSRGGKILGLNDGGSVPGVGNTDSIPAMLTPGEYVVNAQSAGKHAALLRAINNGNGSTAYLNKGGQAGGGSSSGGSFGGFSLGGFGAAADKIKEAMSVLTSVSPMFASFTAAAEMINNALSGFSVGAPIQHVHSHNFSGSVNIDIVGMDITDEIESRLRSVGTDMVNAQLISVLTKMSEGEAPSTIAAGLQTGGTNAGS